MEIQIELEDVSTVKKKLKIEIPAHIAGKEFEEIARNYRKYARLPGFRPGKAPLALVKRRFHTDIRDDLVQKLIPESYEQAVREKAVSPLGNPDLENLKFEEGEALTYEALFEVKPQIPLPDYHKLQLSYEKEAVEEETIDQEIDKLRKEHARLVAVEDRPVEAGDVATIDLRGRYLTEEGDVDEDRHEIVEEDVAVNIGEEQTHKAFNEALDGMNIGEETTFDVDYPSDYPEAELAGRRLRFTAEVTDIKKPETPEANDDFAKDLGEYDSLSQLREKIRENLEERRSRDQEQHLRSQAVDKLVAESDFEVPGVLVEERMDQKIRDVAYEMSTRGVDPRRSNIDWKEVRTEIRPEAEKEVRASLILEEIARVEKLEISEADLKAEMGKIARSSNQPEEKVQQYFQQDGRLEGLQKQLLRRAALNRVLESANLESPDEEGD